LRQGLAVVAQASLKLDIPTLAFPVLGLQACVTTPSPAFTFFYKSACEYLEKY
jgi:hypothetical protein